MKSYKLFLTKAILPGLQMLLILLLFTLPTTALPTPSGYDVQRPVYAFDFLTYKSGNGEETLLEIFCQIPTDDLIFIQFQDGFFSSYDLTIRLFDPSGNEIVSQSLIDSVKVKSFKDIYLPRLPSLIRVALLVEPGEYEFRIRLTDMETLKDVRLQGNIEIPNYSKTDLQLSELQLATSITVTAEKNLLVKNYRKVIPNVPGIVGAELKHLFVYSEVYNLRYNAGEPHNELVATYTIKNEKGVEVKSIKRHYKKPGDTCALSIGIPVAGLESGQYQLILDVEDPARAQSVRNFTNFYVTKPNPEPNLLSQLLPRDN